LNVEGLQGDRDKTVVANQAGKIDNAFLAEDVDGARKGFRADSIFTDYLTGKLNDYLLGLPEAR